MADDFYSVLGVQKGADADAIKKAYRKLARDLHPDRNPGDKAAEARFKAVNRAYEALHDPKKRVLYDEFGEEALRDGFDADKARQYRAWQANPGRGGGFGNVGGRAVSLEDLFGGATSGGSVEGHDFADLFGRGRRRGPVRGQDMEQEITVDFDTAVRGTSLELRRPEADDSVTVRIPPGADDGSRVRIAGQGGHSPNGGPNGDLILVIHVRPHPLFKREGDDLHVDVPVTVSEAVKGAKVRVPTFEGPVVVKVPAGTMSGATLRVRGKGVARKGRPTGDLYVHVMVHVPTGSSPELLRLVTELEPFEDQDLRKSLDAYL